MQNIIDAHCHIYPRKIAPKAVEGINRFYDLKMDAKGTVEDLLEREMKAGVTHFLCHSVATKPEQVNSINEFISEEVKLHKGLITGFGTLHPDSEDMEGDISRLIELGLEGVKMHPDFQHYHIDGERSVRLSHMVADAGLPILVHCGDYRYDLSNPERVANFLKKVPEITMIGAHFGGWSMWDEAAQLLAGRFKNLYVDCSSSLYALEPGRATELVREYGADRVLFGTDYPMWDINDELERFSKMDLTDEERRMVLCDNAVRLLKIDD